MEQSHPTFEAQACLGRRAIFRTACQHRLPCPTGIVDGARRVHIDGFVFRTAEAAQRFDLAAGDRDRCGQTWHTFPTWAQAETWLRDGCPSTDAAAPTTA